MRLFTSKIPAPEPEPTRNAQVERLVAAIDDEWWTEVCRIEVDHPNNEADHERAKARLDAVKRNSSAAEIAEAERTWRSGPAPDPHQRHEMADQADIGTDQAIADAQHAVADARAQRETRERFADEMRRRSDQARHHQVDRNNQINPPARELD